MPSRIDHLVVAVRDLDAAASLYRRLGFQVGGRNWHPWGTENRIVQLESGFVELITVGEGASIPPHGARAFSFGAFVADYLAEREGLAMLALDSGDAVADAARFARAGIGSFEPFRFERRGRRPDGSEVPLAFTLAFASDPSAPRAGFFVCQHHHPENFWNPEFRRHPNGALRLATVTLASDHPLRHRSFLEAFCDAPAPTPQGPDLSIPLEEGRIDVLTRDGAALAFASVEAPQVEPGFVALTIEVADMTRVLDVLADESLPHSRIGSRAVVPASAAFGVAIAFEAA